LARFIFATPELSKTSQIEALLSQGNFDASFPLWRENAPGGIADFCPKCVLGIEV
jgi:hypothetical protein